MAPGSPNGDFSRFFLLKLIGNLGGPLLCDGVHDRGWTIHGITSFGTTCGQSGPPVGVYTRVQHYISWLYSICGNNCEKSVRDITTDSEEIERNIAKLKSSTSGKYSYLHKVILKSVTKQYSYDN